jgi:hypothetical protein
MHVIPFTFQRVPGTLEINGANVFVRWAGAAFQREAASATLGAAIDQAIAAQEERDRNTRVHYASLSRNARRRYLDD